MGDVVGSKKNAGNILAKHFAAMAAYINQTYQTEILSPLTITLGDEFQGIVKNCRIGEEIILAAEEWLLQLDIVIRIRYVLQFGEIETPINHKIAYGMLGSGLTETRNILNELKKEKDRFKICGVENASVHNDYWVLYQSITDAWNLNDRNLVADFLTLDDYKKVAVKQGKNQSLMWKRERSLKIREYKIIKELILKD